MLFGADRDVSRQNIYIAIYWLPLRLAVCDIQLAGIHTNGGIGIGIGIKSNFPDGESNPGRGGESAES